MINLIPPKIKSCTVLWTVACSHSASPHFCLLNDLRWVHTDTPTVRRAYACALSCVPFPGFLTGPNQGARREQSEWIRVDCPESANSSPSTSWTPENQHLCEHFLKKRSIGSGKWGPCHAFFRQQGADWAGILSKAFLILKSNRPRSFL